MQDQQRGGPPLDEPDLIREAQQGDTDAFEQLMQRYQQAAFRAAFLITRDPAEAEDVSQESFLRAYRALRTFSLGRPFRAWLLRIVANQALNAVKSMRRRAVLTERYSVLQQPLAAPVEELAADSERRRAFRSAIDLLPDKDRVVIYLHYFLRLHERETAEVLRCRPGTVKSRVHRATRRLRGLIESRFPGLTLEEPR
jgi:RNA polymerase sigma-70 factor (ECF subfamily)